MWWNATVLYMAPAQPDARVRGHPDLNLGKVLEECADLHAVIKL
jgi:hypothetical protein